MADAVTPHAEALATLAVEETGYGVVADKVQKNLFSSRQVYEFIAPMKTVGVVNRHRGPEGRRDRRAVRRRRGHRPVDQPDVNGDLQGVDRAEGALPDRDQPASVRGAMHHPRGRDHGRGRRTAPARRPGRIGWMKTVTLEGTQELMKHRDVAVILATGGMGLVRAAYSAGKPAYGVGPGNAPCYIEQSADLAKAAHDIVLGKTFDNGVLCSSPNSVVVDEAVSEEARRQFQAAGRLLHERARDGRARQGAGHVLSGCPTRRWSANRRRSSPRKSG